MNEIKEYPLSDDDIRKVLGNVKIWNYPQLKDITINDLFDDQGRAILLCPSMSANSGHWVCLIDKPDSIEYYDSYGDKPEAPKKGLGKARLEALDIDHPYLTTLLRSSGKPVFYNTHQFQSSSPNVATCGKHCCARLLYAPFSLKKYKGIIDKSKLSADDFVSALVYHWLEK